MNALNWGDLVDDNKAASCMTGDLTLLDVSALPDLRCELGTSSGDVTDVGPVVGAGYVWAGDDSHQ